MSKITYSSLKLKNNIDKKIVKFEDKEIEVYQFLSIDDKYALVNISLQEAKEGSIYNPVKLDMFFHLNLVYMYTNLSFTDKQRENQSKIYDELVTNGLMNEIISKIPESEYNTLYNYIQDLIKDTYEYKNTISGIITELIESLPVKAEEMQKIVDNFDPQKFQNVFDFVKAANGGNNPNL